MNVLSLFGGIETGLLALKELGIYPKNYYSSEIDKFACSVSRYLHPEIKELGDIKNYKSWNLPKIDLILAGPPCQGFSISGKVLNWVDPRSQLFFTAIEILWKYRPKYFFFENVYSMTKIVRTEIDELMETKSVMTNSNLVSAQNRKRLYWTKLPGPQPEFVDQNIYLKDILESGYPLTDKSQTIVSTIYKKNVKSMVKRNKKGLLVCEPDVEEKYYLDINSVSGKRALKNLVDGLRFDYEKSLALTKSNASKYSNSGSTVLIVQTPRGNNRGAIKAIDGKTPTLTDANFHYNDFIFQHIRKNASEETFLKVSKKLLLKDHQDKASTLTGGAKSAGNHSAMDLILYPNMRFRRLTPVECERLQTLPDNTTQFGINEKGKVVNISDSQRYKMTGNGWTKDVIKKYLEAMQ